MHRYWQMGLLCVLVVSESAQADESNFRPYIVGARAAGMGGAFTALADDGSGPYYNPGGVAFVERSMLSLSASVYGLVQGTEKDALADGHDFRYSDLNVFPVSTSGIMKVGAADSTGTSPNAIALSVFVPDAMRIDDRDVLLGSNDNSVFVTQDEQTIWAGATYARRMNRLGIGVSAFLLVGTSTDYTDFAIINRATSPALFLTNTGRTDSTILGGVAAIGVRYELTERLKLGASFYSPEVGLAGSRKFFARVNTTNVPGFAPIVVNRDDLHASPSLPWRAQAGIAWISDGLTLSADIILLGPREVHDDAELASQGLDRNVKRNMVVNGSLGLEWLVAKRVPIRAGAFTDFAASPSPSLNWDNSMSHLNRYGGTASIGYRTEHTSTDLGVNVSYASGEALEPKNLDLTNFVATPATQTLFYVFLATAYQF